jgi:hypothetical protein
MGVAVSFSEEEAEAEAEREKTDLPLSQGSNFQGKSEGN